jgi:hypothetical protein
MRNATVPAAGRSMLLRSSVTATFVVLDAHGVELAEQTARSSLRARACTQAALPAAASR